MNLQDLLNKIESNLIDTLVYNDVDIDSLGNATQVRAELRRLLKSSALEAVEQQMGSNASVSQFTRDFGNTVTSNINEALQIAEGYTLDPTVLRVSIQDAIESFAGDGNLLSIVNGLRDGGAAALEETTSEFVNVVDDFATSLETPTSQVEPSLGSVDEVVDDLLRNNTSTQMQEILELFKSDDIKSVADTNLYTLKQLKEFLEDIRIGNSTLYGQDMKIYAGLEETVDEEFVPTLEKYAKEKGMVLELSIERGIDTGHNEGSRINRESVNLNYSANETNDIRTDKVYFPEETDDVAKRVKDYIVKQKRIFSETENINFAKITQDGPEFTTNLSNHFKYGQFIARTFQRNNELNQFLDTQDFKVIMIGGSTKGSTAERAITPLYKGGVKKYFEKLARKPKGEKLKGFIDKPSYTLATVWNGEVINLVASDSRRSDTVSNSVRYIPDQNFMTLDTNFYSTNPNTVVGYYPSLADGGSIFKRWKNQLYFAAEEWFQGILHLADLDSVNIEVSALNGQVGNLYQMGGFIAVKPPHESTISSIGTMIRIPNKDRKTKDGWKVVREKGEWRASLSGAAESRAWGSPGSERYTWERRSFNDIKKSPRHQALLGIINAEYFDSFHIGQRDDLIRHIFNLGGMESFGENRLKTAFTQSIDANKPLKYILPANKVGTLRNSLFEELDDIKFLARLMLRTTSLRDITGITIEPGDIDGNISTNLETSSSLTGNLSNREVLNVVDEILDNADESVLINMEVIITDSIDDDFNVSEYYYGDGPQPPSSQITPQTTSSPTNAEQARTIYNSAPDFVQQLATNLSPEPPHSFGLHVLYDDFNSANTFRGVGSFPPTLHEDSNIYRKMELDALTNQPFEYRISDSFRHKYVNYLNQLYSDQGFTLLSVDIESVGDGLHPLDYIEVGHIVEKKTHDGQAPYIKKEYDTFSLIRHTDEEKAAIIVGQLSTGNNNFALRALNQSLMDEGFNLTPSTGNLNSDYIHPTGRIGEAMGVTNVHSEAFNNQMEIDVKFVRDITQEGVQSTRQPNIKSKLNAKDITPQPFYSSRQFRNLAIPGSSIQTTLDELVDAFDNKISGAWSTDIVANIAPEAGGQVIKKNIGTIVKRSGQAPTITMYDSLPDGIDPIRVENGRIIMPETNVNIIMNSLNVLVPDKDFFNNKLAVVLNDISNFDTSQVFASSLNNDTLPRYQIWNGNQVPLFDEDDLPRIRSSYSFGADMGDGGTDFIGIPFNENRPPVGSNPDTMTLRKIARSFAKTKTGKTLGLAWKTIDIGETLISKAFAQAQKAALAAGATTLGGAAAFAATAWAVYEISNLIIAAGQQIPELKEVFERRNEILANGEEWEKQIVEETFWQDYGPELLEALQTAGERSPSEILSDKIWTFTLDNLRRQADGEVFEESLIDSSEELDTKDNIYYSNMTDDYKLEQMQKEIDYDKVYVGYLNNRPEANAIANRTFELANNVYNRDR